MRRANSSFALARLCIVVAGGFFSASMFVLGIQAQPASQPEPYSGASLLVTNLLQLSKLFDSSSRIIADVRLDVLVCSKSRAEIGVVAVKDKTGSEVLEFGPRSVAIAAGDVIHIEGRRCLLRSREIGIEMTKAPDLDDDGTHALQRVTAEVSLAKGLHPFQLDYFNLYAAHGLELSCSLPDGSVQLASRFLVSPSGDTMFGSNLVAGVTATCYEGVWLNVPDFSLPRAS